MMFLFAWIAQSREPPGWPVQLMHQAEALFVVVASICLMLAIVWRRFVVSKTIGAQVIRGLIAVVGGVSASFGLIMPLELAPFFFHIGGEIMMATMVLILFYVPTAGLFIVLFALLMNPQLLKKIFRRGHEQVRPLPTVRD
jgi:hypothetical protein